MAEKIETKKTHIVLKQINPDTDLYDVRVRAKTKVGHGQVLDYVLNFGKLNAELPWQKFLLVFLLLKHCSVVTKSCPNIFGN